MKANIILKSSLTLALLAFQGCEKTTESPRLSAQTTQAEWLISGRMAHENFDLGEVVALSTGGKRFQSSIGSDNGFNLNLPGDDTYAVYFLPPPSFKSNLDDSAASAAVGATIEHGSPALLTFDEDSEIGMRDTLRLPKTTPSGGLDLGLIDIKGDYAYPATNPATKLDFDGDGIPDSQDHDDENDGLSDAPKNAGSERITICHENNQTISVALSALLAHLNHQDSVGECDREHKKPAQADQAPSADSLVKKPDVSDDEHEKRRPDAEDSPDHHINEQLIFEEDANHQDHEDAHGESDKHNGDSEHDEDDSDYEIN